MPRLFSAAMRSDPLRTTPAYNSVLLEQMAACVGRAGEIDLDALLAGVSARYDSLDDERRGAVLSMQLMSHEAQALTRAIRLEAASQLETVLGHVDDAVITLDEVGRVESINPAGERLFGYAARDVTGRSLDFLLPDAPAASGADGRLIDFLESCSRAGQQPAGGRAARVITARGRDGAGLTLEISVSTATLGRRNGYLAFLRDITDRQRLAAIATGERRIFEALDGAGLQSVLLAIAEAIESVVPHAGCAIDLLDAESRVLRHAVAPTLPRTFVAAMDGSPVGLKFGSSAAVVCLGRRSLVADMAAEPSWDFRASVAAHAGLRSAWVEPIPAADGSIVGTIGIYRRLAGLPQNRDVEWMSRLAQIAAIALERHASPARIPDSGAGGPRQRLQPGNTVPSRGNRAVI